jgi:hypothetical protein
MAKTAKKKPMSKAAAAALEELENLVIKTAELDVHTKQVTERLKAAGLGSDIGSIAYAGRASSGSGQVQVNISSGGFASTWPEWAFGVAEGALHFNKKVWVIYNNQPFGSNLLQVLCLNTAVWSQPGLGAMGNLPFWLGIGAAQKSAQARGLKRSRHPIISFVVGLAVALAIVAGIFVLFAYQG